MRVGGFQAGFLPATNWDCPTQIQKPHQLHIIVYHHSSHIYVSLLQNINSKHLSNSQYFSPTHMYSYTHTSALFIQSLQTSNMEQRPLSHIHQTSIYISTYLNCPVSQASTPLNPSSKPRSPCSSHWCFATVSFHSFVVKRHEATKPRGLNQEKL